MTKIVKNITELDFNGTYTYADYLLWWFDQRVELIKGKIFQMSPAPNRKHQSISFKLTGIFFNEFREKTCKVFSAPFDVRLLDKTKSQAKNEEIYTVVQPDLCVICDGSTRILDSISVGTSFTAVYIE